MSKTKPTASATAIPALTTTFTPSPYCLSELKMFTTTPSSLCVSGTGTIDCKWTQLGPTRSTSDCLPPEWNAYGASYYSPGVCPSGYSINDCSRVKVVSDTIRETRGTCCPSGYTCQTKTAGPGIPVWQSTNLCFQESTTTKVHGTNTDSGTTVNQVASLDVLHAHGISIRWQDSARATTTASSTGGASSSNSLSTGARAGAGVGAAIGFVLLILTAAMLYFKLGRRKASPEPTEQRPYADSPAELDGSQMRSELSATQVTSELPGERYTYTAELPGSSRSLAWVCGMCFTSGRSPDAKGY